MPLGDVWGNSWLDTWNAHWRQAVAPPPPPVDVTIPAGAAMRRAARRVEPAIQTVRVPSILVSGGGAVYVTGHKAVEYPPDDELVQFLGMI